jgi:TonB family protein
VAPVFVRSQNVVPFVTAAEPLASERAPLPIPGTYGVPVHPVPPVPFYRLEDSQPSQRRGPAVWIACGMVLAVALGSGWMLYQKGRAIPQTTAALKTVPSSNLSADEKNDRAPAPASSLHNLQAPVIRRSSPAVARHLNDSRAPLTRSRATEDAPLVGSLRPLNAGGSLPSANSTSPAKPDVITRSNPVTKPSNATPESAAKSTSPATTTTASTSSVRRRLPKSIELNPPPPRPRGSSDGLNASASGVVHPASIGMMASNLISSPAPAYPAAASQAQVQGEVTVRAVVDRDGNVIDARVVSGPELLRDVSLEAVQHWRYRPHMQGGKPVEVATTAILDFELP